MASEAAKLAENLEYGFYDRLTPTQLANEVAARSIDPSTARPNSSFVQLLLRDDNDAKRAAIDHNRNNVTLIGLPAEIRNTIYALVIDDHNTVFRAHGYDANPVYWQNKYKEPSLLQICNSIRRETIPMYFSIRRWVFNDTRCDGPLAMATMRTWAAERGHKRLRVGREVKVRAGQVTLQKRRAEYFISINGTIDEGEMQMAVRAIKEAVG